MAATVPVEEAEDRLEPGSELRFRVSTYRLSRANPSAAPVADFDLPPGYSAWAVAVARWGIATYNMLSNDRPWWAGISFTLSIVEINTGLICACVATLGPLWKLASASVKGRSTRRDSEASTWPASFHKYRLSGLLHKNKTPSRHSQVQKQGYENVARNEALISPPMRAQRGDAMYYSGDDEYILLDYSGARGSNSAEDPSWRERIV